MELANLTELCQLAYKYGTDKCPQIRHTYTPFYNKLLKDKRNSIKKVLEIGVGRHKGSRRRVNGASLYMWREFFSNAVIYGVDINPQTIFQDERIKTFLCDARKKEDLVKLIEYTGSDIDLFIDDGSHEVNDQAFTCLNLMPLLQKKVIYIVEDVTFSKKLIAKLSQYECEVPPIQHRGGINQLVIVKNKALAK